MKRRKEIHEKIGQAVEKLYSDRLEEYCELLAYHYVRSDNKEMAVEYLDRANRKAIKASAMGEAKAFFEEAMKLLDTLPDTEKNREMRISLLVNQSVVFFMLLKMTEYYEILTRYEVLATSFGNPGLLGAFYVRVGHCEYESGSLLKAIETEKKAAELCEAAGIAEDAGYAYMVGEYSYLFRGDLEQVLVWKDDALRKMDENFNLRWYVWAVACASLACACMGRWDEAVDLGQEALKTAEDFSDNSLVSFAGFCMCFAHNLKGDLGCAIKYGELAVQKAPTPFDKALAELFLSWTWCNAGESNKRIDFLAELTEGAKAISNMIIMLPSLMCLCEGYLLAGEYIRARQAGEELSKMADRCGSRLYLGWAYRLLGEIALKTNADEATSHFEKAICIYQSIKAKNFLALAYSGMGRFHKQQGNTAQAREYLTNALEIFERLGTFIEPDKVRKELAELG